MSYLLHERLYRGEDALKVLAEAPITVCGAGALGANLTESLARSGCRRLRLIDRDRVEARNLSTQPFLRDDIGARKAAAIAHALFRAVGVDVKIVSRELTARNAGELLRGSALVVDAFDNSVGRAAVTAWCRSAEVPCLHLGMADGYGEATWNEGYRVPGPGRDDLCDVPLARSLVLLTVAVGAEVAVRFLTRGERQNVEITLEDLRVSVTPG